VTERRGTRARRLVVAAASLLCVGVLAGAVPAAQAYPAATVELTGHGWGHGRGLGQWGALGYALDHGWAYSQILNHYYGGTHAGSLGGDVPMSVQLTRFDGRDTVVMQERGQLGTTVAGGSYAALRPRLIAANTFAVEQAPGCAGPWTPLTVVAGPVTFFPQAPSASDRGSMIQACEPDGTRRWLRGNVQAVDAGGVARTVNHLPMESYLRGVVPLESSPSWGALGGGLGMHALRAQAVAARSYAQGESRSAVAKTCDTTSCQVYGGVAKLAPNGAFTSIEHAATDVAVRETSAEVRRFPSGAVARTEFSSSTGGWTAGGTFPAVPDLGDTRAPHHNWTASIPVASIEAALPTIGSLQAVDVTRRNGLGAGGGRVLEVVVRGSSGSVTRTGPQFRAQFGLRSDWFFVANPQPRALSWYLRNSLTTGRADVAFPYGDEAAQVLTCDWNGNGTDTPGIYRSGRFSLRSSNGTASTEVNFYYGNAEDVAVCGDWDGDGTDTVGVKRGGTWYLRNTNSTGVADVALRYGDLGDVPVAGDWDGNGTDTVGLKRGGTWYLRNTNSTGVADVSLRYGDPGDVPVAGDWDGNGTDTVGVKRGGTWYLRNANTTGVADLALRYGDLGDVPIAGDWDGNGTDTLGVTR
jgi:SpoIID/LytB domain protein